MIIVDSNVLIDIVGGEARWYEWSLSRLDAARSRDELVINPVVYAEIAPQFAGAAELDGFLTEGRLIMFEFTRAACYLAGHAQQSYRGRGGQRDRVLADFLIGAQAVVTGAAILTRDPRRYRTAFPDVGLITP